MPLQDSITSWLLALQRAATRNGLTLVAFYLLVSFALRWFAFGTSVVDWDETTYLLIGKGLVEGKRMYVDVWDTKSPAIFYIASVFVWLFENPILPFRIFGAVCIALTAWLVHQIARTFRPADGRFALIAGTFYIVLMSFQSFAYSLGKGFGMDVNSEVIFLLISTAGWWQFFKHPHSAGRLLLAGLLLGIAFVIKYFVLFDLVALTLIAVLRFRGLGVWGMLWRLICVGASSVLPFAVMAGYYYWGSGIFDLWYEVTFEVGSRYSESLTLPATLRYWGDFFFLTTFVALSFIGLLVAFVRHKSWKKHRWIGWLFVWMLVLAAGVSWPAKWHYHYIYQLFPAYALLGAAFYTQAVVPSANTRKKYALALAVVLVATWPIITAIKITARFAKPDYPVLVGDYISAKNIPDLRIHIDNTRNVIHFYTGTLPLTKYYHPSLIYRKSHIQTLQLDRNAEIDRILAQQPHYVIARSGLSSSYWFEQLKTNYVKDTIFSTEYHLWRHTGLVPD